MGKHETEEQMAGRTALLAVLSHEAICCLRDLLQASGHVPCTVHH